MVSTEGFAKPLRIYLYSLFGCRQDQIPGLPDELKYKDRVKCLQPVSWEKLPALINQVDVNLAPLELSNLAAILGPFGAQFYQIFFQHFAAVHPVFLKGPALEMVNEGVSCANKPVPCFS